MPGILYCPLPPTVHPAAAEIDRQVSAWFSQKAPAFPTPEQHQGLLNSQSSAYVANCSPGADTERLVWGGRLFVGGFALDDWLEDIDTVHDVLTVTTAMQGRLSQPSSPMPARMPAGAWELWCDMADGARSYSTPLQFTRFREGYGRYHHHLALETSCRLNKITPTFDEHPALRLGVSAFGPFLTALEIYRGEEVPAQDADLPAFNAFCEAVAILLLWANDIATYQPGDVNNLLDVLTVHRRCGREEAAFEAISLWNRGMVVLLRLHQRLEQSRISASTRLFLANALNMIGNIVTWHTGNSRYPSAGFEVADLVTPTVPRGLDESPIPSTAIAWWWDHIG